MKFFHLSDLHLGKRVFGFSMAEEQRFILERILEAAEEEAPDACLIAGDIYDKPVPSAEAVELFDSFLYRLSGLVPDVFVISGNHDSPERIAFGGRLMEREGVHLSPVYSGEVKPVRLTDSLGEVCVYSLPFLKPVHVRRALEPEKDGESLGYTEAFRLAVDALGVDPSLRNVLIAHQLVLGGVRSESEEVSIGGTDAIDAAVFDPFDYVALGHLHRPQNVAANARYCGTPLPYSFSEAGDEKSITVVELSEKGSLPGIRLLPLRPRRPFLRLRGRYDEVVSKAFYQGLDTDAYIEMTLTDEEDVPNAVGKLRVVYPHLMRLAYDNRRTRSENTVLSGEERQMPDPGELMNDFYKKVNGRDLEPEERAYLLRLLERIRAGKEEA